MIECIIIKRRMLVKDPQPLFTPLCISQLLSHADFVVSVTLNRYKTKRYITQIQKKQQGYNYFEKETCLNCQNKLVHFE